MCFSNDANLLCRPPKRRSGPRARVRISHDPLPIPHPSAISRTIVENSKKEIGERKHFSTESWMRYDEERLGAADPKRKNEMLTSRVSNYS